ncbi:hypothetical protein [Methylobacterium indicum]|uniref:hypothetical protein n=1 Tax=Methylobacterium indicum TaxID=1775910 RepID=UPI000B10BE2C|nr:hypothetical protein [Methylobacterium indicum]
MRWTHLVTLMDAEATRQEQANDHPAAILLREGAEAIRKESRSPGVGMAPLDQLIRPNPDPRRDAAGEKAPKGWRGSTIGSGSTIPGTSQ